MNAQEADRQIQQLIAFIYQEAREKAEEIMVKTESEFMALKLNLQQQAGQQIREEFEKKKKDLIISRKIERSKHLTNARFSTMQQRDGKMKVLKQEVQKRLGEVAKSPKYNELIRFLLAQGLLTIQEEKVKVHCRKEDEKIVQGEMEAAKKLFQDAIAEATKDGPNGTITPNVDLELDTKDYLPPAPQKGSEGLPACYGGIKLSARNGKIVLKNTLDSRLDLAFQQLQPQIRGLLFGVRPPAVSKAPEPAPHHH